MTEYMTLKEKPILFKGDMVRAILEGRKTETRRIVKPQPSMQLKNNTALNEKSNLYWLTMFPTDAEDDNFFWKCPYGQVGDRLWVREAFYADNDCQIKYKADPLTVLMHGECWKPSIHMFRKYSRITLEITEISVERVQDITEEGAKAEGINVEGIALALEKIYERKFADLWDSINEKRGFGWESNPWVWVVKFKVVK